LGEYLQKVQNSWIEMFNLFLMINRYGGSFWLTDWSFVPGNGLDTPLPLGALGMDKNKIR
jgi:hypothetical protein